MDSTAPLAAKRKLAIGVDSDKHLHVPVPLDELGPRLGELTISCDSGGYAALAVGAEQIGGVAASGSDGSGGSGVGVGSFFRRGGHRVVEVNRGDRPLRRSNGKSDALDAA